MATPQHRDYFAQHLLPAVIEHGSEESISGFLSMKGERYNNDLMVIGRAPNGWLEGDLKKIVPSLYARRIYESVTVGEKEPCPMSWVHDYWDNPDHKYKAKRSAFWRTVKSVVLQSGIGEDKWWSYLVWSNLYKVAPKKGNPGAKLIRLQQKDCISLLRQELSDYRPRRVLFLTGLNWAKPFLKSIAPSFIVLSYDKRSHVQATAEIAGCKIVVATHPQGKPEDIWVKEVMRAFQA